MQAPTPGSSYAARVFAGVTLVLALGSCRAPSPDPGLGEAGRTLDMSQYRVALERPPVEAALWLAATHPAYFRSGEQGLVPWLETLEPRERVFVVALGQTLTWAWVEHEIAQLPALERPVAPTELAAVAHAAIATVRGKTLNQLELDAEHFAAKEHMEFEAYLADPGFGPGVFARLIRGLNNCEGQNHLLALLLDSALDPPRPWLPQRVRADMAGLPGHDLVRVRDPDWPTPVFVDAWSNLPAFTASPEALRPVIGAERDSLAPLLSGLAGREPQQPDAYASSEGLRIELRPARNAAARPVDLSLRPPALDPARLAAAPDPWQPFLFARILHIYDDPRAAEVYAVLLDNHCQQRAHRLSYPCKAAERLAPRVRARAD